MLQKIPSVLGVAGVPRVPFQPWLKRRQLTRQMRPTSEEPPPAPPTAPPPAPPTAQPPAAAGRHRGETGRRMPGPWHVDVNGYFRAPMALGISSRPGPDNLTGPSSTQVSYGPNRTVDANYYSFAYTRLQEQDWAEVFVHARKKHVDAAVGWMGYWFQSVGFRNYDAAWAPGLAYVALDTDLRRWRPQAEHYAHGRGLVAELWVFREVRHLHARAFSPAG